MSAKSASGKIMKVRRITSVQHLHSCWPSMTQVTTAYFSIHFNERVARISSIVLKLNSSRWNWMAETGLWPLYTMSDKTGSIQFSLSSSRNAAKFSKIVMEFAYSWVEPTCECAAYNAQTHANRSLTQSILHTKLRAEKNSMKLEEKKFKKIIFLLLSETICYWRNKVKWEHRLIRKMFSN